MHPSTTMLLKSLFITVLMICLCSPGVLAEQKAKGAGAAAAPKAGGTPAPAAGDAPTTGKGGLQQRIDFGSSQILGQSIKSGAVYLMHRKKSDIKNMLEVRKHYRDEIKEDFGLEQTAISSDATGPGDTLKQ